MSIHDQFAVAVNDLSKVLELPHLRPDESGRVSVRYKNAFDLEILCSSEGAIQMHAYLISKDLTSCSPELGYQLLAWNNDQSDLGGSYIGMHHNSGFITLNSFLLLEAIDCVVLENIINSFLDEAESIKLKIESLIQEHDPDQGDRSKYGDDPSMFGGLRV